MKAFVFDDDSLSIQFKQQDAPHPVRFSIRDNVKIKDTAYNGNFEAWWEMSPGEVNGLYEFLKDVLDK